MLLEVTILTAGLCIAILLASLLVTKCLTKIANELSYLYLISVLIERQRILMDIEFEGYAVPKWLKDVGNHLGSNEEEEKKPNVHILKPKVH